MDTIFPDEIFQQIFRYTQPVDLFRGFYNLNSRLNRIIGEVRIHLRYRYTDDERRYIFPNLNPKQIRSFYVCEEEYQYPRLSECSNIRELSFSWNSQCDVYSIRHPQLVLVQPKNYPRLRSLTICQQSWTSEFQKLCKMIFGNQFPFLEHVSLPYANGSCIPGIKTWSTRLSSVSIECCNMSMLYPLLDNLPNLQSFHCTPGTPTGGSLKTQRLALQNFTFTNYDQNSPHQMEMMGMSEIEHLFRHFPNLESTLLLLGRSGTLDEAFRSLNAILSHCPKLRSVDCYMKYSGPDCSQKLFDEVKNRYPLFRDYQGGAWKEHHDHGYRCRIRKG